MDDTRGVCGICRRQVAKYACPRCNLPYCSLPCFRSEAHSQCSEAFYKREVEDEIQAAPKTPAERRQMLELLKRFEEENVQDEPALDGGEAEDLAARIADLDIDAAGPEALWAALNDNERQRFESILRDADGVVARQLLAEESKTVPWWADDEDGAPPPPTPLPVDDALVDKARSMKGPPLLYNIFCLCLAYTHAIRTYALSTLSESPDDAATKLLSKLAPFLVERKSTQVFQSIEEAVTFFWSHITPTNAHMTQLLEDAQRVLLPVAVYEEASGGPHHRALRMLGDLSTAFRKSHVAPKLLFYGAHLLAQPLQVYSLLRAEIDAQRKALETKDDT